MACTSVMTSPMHFMHGKQSIVGVTYSSSLLSEAEMNISSYSVLSTSAAGLEICLLHL